MNCSSFLYHTGKSQCDSIANEILMHFRSQRKLQSEVSLTDTLEAGDGDSLSLMDVIAVDEDMQEELNTKEACKQVRECVENCLSERERQVISLRYGLDGNSPKTQREVAVLCGISRSYVSRCRYCKRQHLPSVFIQVDGR